MVRYRQQGVRREVRRGRLGQGPPRDLVPRAELRRLAPGIDALYLSGWTSLSPLSGEQLHEGQLATREAGEAPPFPFGRTEFAICPHKLGHFPYRLERRFGVLAICCRAGSSVGCAARS